MLLELVLLPPFLTGLVGFVGRVLIVEGDI